MAKKGTKGIFAAQLDVEDMSGPEAMAPRSVCLKAAHVDWGEKEKKSPVYIAPGRRHMGNNCRTLHRTARYPRRSPGFNRLVFKGDAGLEGI